MRTNHLKTNSDYAHFALAEIFDGKRVANVRIHLNWGSIPTLLRHDFAKNIATKFRNNISRRYFSNAARRGNFAACVIHLHRDEVPHLHILVEIPEHQTLEDVRQFVGEFVNKSTRNECGRLIWNCVPARSVNTLFYAEEVENLIGSLIYNQRYGLESALLF
jgi:hypothetical protein